MLDRVIPGELADPLVGPRDWFGERPRAGVLVADMTAPPAAVLPLGPDRMRRVRTKAGLHRLHPDTGAGHDHDAVEVEDLDRTAVDVANGREPTAESVMRPERLDRDLAA